LHYTFAPLDTATDIFAGYRDFTSCLRWFEKVEAEEEKIAKEVKNSAVGYQTLVDRRGGSEYAVAFPVLQKALAYK
jgi:hypothetical protein